MITWNGPTPPPLDPHRRELHQVEMLYTTEQAATDAARFVVRICALAFVFVLGFLLGAHE
jgi:hypothetical protein